MPIIPPLLPRPAKSADPAGRQHVGGRLLGRPVFLDAVAPIFELQRTCPPVESSLLRRRACCSWGGVMGATGGSLLYLRACMRTCDLHGRRYLLATLLALACLTLSAHRAAGQTYTQPSQTRSMRAEVTARVPGRPDVTDVQTEESMELGSFDRSISASATASEGGVMVTVQGNARQRVAYLADSITGVLTAQTTTETIGGDSAARVFSFFQPYCRVSDAGNVPYVLTGRIRGNFGPLDGTVTVGLALVDEDTPDQIGIAS